MATEFKDLPPCSQQSASELSDPPEFSEDELREITVNMAPITRRRSSYTLTDSQPEVNGTKAPVKPSDNTGSFSNDDDEVEAEIHVSAMAPRRRVPSKRSQFSNSKPTASRQPAAKRPKTTSKKWEPNYVTQSSKSPLVGKDLRALLLHPQAWDLLSQEDKAEIIALFPDEKHILDAATPNARPDVMSLQNDDNFRHDTEEYVSNLSRDMHDPSWLQDAWAAHGSRTAGNFDQFYIRRLEADWKTTIPDEMKPEHLRTGPKPEASVVACQPDEGSEAVGNGAAGYHETRDHVVGKQEVGEPEVIDTIMASGLNDSMIMGDEIEVNGNVNVNVKADDASIDGVKSHAEDGIPPNGANGIEKVSDAKVNGNESGDYEKMQTGSE